MKRLGVAGVIFSEGRVLLGRRGKNPNRGLYVLPGGGVEEGESLDAAFRREVLEETGVVIPPDSNRWTIPQYLIELPDRIILIAQVMLDADQTPRDGDDLYDVAWWNMLMLPKDLSPVIRAPLAKWGLVRSS